MGRRPLVLGNWKMNLTHLEAISLVQRLAFTLTPAELDRVEVVVVPPFVDLRSVQTLVDGDRLGLRYGAQDLSPHPAGAFTGDISGGMLAALGCRYVLVGHSERRLYHGEDDAAVGAKVLAAYTARLTPVLCVGEALDVRRAGDHRAHCTGALDAALAGVTAEQARSLVLAYEPVWAIGTGEVATPADAQEVCAALRERLAELYPRGGVADAVRVVYGGSVNADNAADLLAQPDVDGALVGGASLTAEAFAAVVRAAPVLRG